MKKLVIRLHTFYKSIIKPRIIKYYGGKTTILYYIIPIITLLIGIYWSNSFTKSRISAVFSGIISLLLLYLANYCFAFINFFFSDNKKIVDASNQYGNAYIKRVKVGKNSLRVLYDPVVVKGRRNLSVTVIDNPDSFYTPPFLVRHHYIEILDAFSNEYIKNFLCYRLDDCSYSKEKGVIILYTSRMYCFDNFVTNFSMDYKIGKEITIRKLYEYGSTLSPLKQSDLGNQIGINAIVSLKDDIILIPRRSWNSTISKNKLTASIAMALEGNINCKKKLSSHDFLFDCIAEGLVYRLGLEKNYAKTYIESIVFLGVGRVINWGGKPQFYYYVELNINALDLLSHSNLADNKGNILDEDREILFCKDLNCISEDTCEVSYLNTRVLLLRHSEKIKKSHFRLEESLIANLYHIANSSVKHAHSDWLFKKLRSTR